MKKLILLLTLSCAVVGTLKAQEKAKPEAPKADTLISKKDLATIQRNMFILQQQLHTLHLDAVLRDKLDSVYYQNMSIIVPKPEERKKQK